MKSLIKSICILSIILTSIPSFGQTNIHQESKKVPAPWNVAFKGGVNIPATDVDAPKPGIIFGADLGYSPIRYLQLNIEFEKGWLTEGEKTNSNEVLHYINNYFSGSLTGKIFPFLINKKTDSIESFFEMIHVGTGFTVIKSQIRSNPMFSPNFGFINAYNGFDILIPLDLGIAIPVWKSKWDNQQMKINVNLRHNLSFTDKLDGYEPIIEPNIRYDVFSQITIGFLYYF